MSYYLVVTVQKEGHKNLGQSLFQSRINNFDLLFSISCSSRFLFWNESKLKHRYGFKLDVDLYEWTVF